MNSLAKCMMLSYDYVNSSAFNVDRMKLSDSHLLVAALKLICILFD